jgi:hypothetical protein
VQGLSGVRHREIYQDRQKYVETRLKPNAKFQHLASQGPEYQNILSDISEYADGVWLWVFLVTRDILLEVDKDEGISTLQKIVNEFPSDLDEYFKCIIERINDRHKEEMAQIFLITIHELQPLPLYAFALLEQERQESTYAFKAPIERILESEVETQYPVLQSRVRNRCGDLLVVDPGQHPVFLSHSVDFMHRTVRDFLRDCYHDELKSQLKSDFNPFVSLCKIYLAFLKGVTFDNFGDCGSVNKIIGLTDEFLYYAHEAEMTVTLLEETALHALLDALDVVNSHHARNVRGHWRKARDSPTKRGHDEYKEGSNYNFLALAIQARLVGYVGAKLQADPTLMHKPDRPLLDYALRPRRWTPISMDYHSTRDDPSVDVRMVELLLSHGADPNQVVYLHGDESVWALFLLSMHETIKQAGPNSAVPDSLKAAWYASCEALIRAGAGSNRERIFVREYIGDQGPLSVSSIFQSAFSSDQARRLLVQMEALASRRDEEELQRNSGKYFIGLRSMLARAIMGS